MNGVKQGPFVIQGIVLPLQLSGNRAERIHHNLLTGFHLFPGFLPVIATRGDDLITSDIRLGIANQHNGKHIHILRIKGA